jgi:hypothetical protein
VLIVSYNKSLPHNVWLTVYSIIMMSIEYSVNIRRAVDAHPDIRSSV